MMLNLIEWHRLAGFDCSLYNDIKIYIIDDVGHYVNSNYSINAGYYSFCYMMLHRYEFLSCAIYNFISLLHGGLDDSTHN